MSGTWMSMRAMSAFQFEGVGMDRPTGIAVELAARSHAELGPLARRLHPIADGVHRPERKRAAGADGPEPIELEDLAVRVDAEDTGAVGDQRSELRTLVRVAILLLGVEEEVLLELGVQAQERVEHLVARAQLQLIR